MKVLVADDDLISRKLLLSYLQKWGYEVVLATDGAEAWRLFEAGDFPLVITDWEMPAVDGLELIQRIRSAPRPSYVYTFLLTARFQKEDLVRGMEAGADDFLSKPFDRDELRVRLRAGERVIQLEQNLRTAQAQLAGLGDGGGANRSAAEVARAIDPPIHSAIENLAILRRELLTALHLVDRLGAEQVPGESTTASSGEISQNMAFVESNLVRLLDQSVASLERVGDSVRSLQHSCK